MDQQPEIDITAGEDVVSDIVVTSEPIADPLPLPPCHVMLDLETWGTGNDAVIVSLGACKFDRDEITDSFHVGINPASCQEFGLKVDADTVLWWMSKDRREALDNWLALEKVDLPSALLGFSLWIGTGAAPLAIWGNGSTFDNVILRSAYKAIGQEYPVRFWQDLCYRTKKQDTAIAIERTGTHHNALDDAISQAKHLQRIWREQDQQPLRDMLERCHQQFTFYGEQHRAKIPGLQGGHVQPDRGPELEATIKKAEVNEQIAFDIRQLLCGGPREA